MQLRPSEFSGAHAITHFGILWSSCKYNLFRKSLELMQLRIWNSLELMQYRLLELSEAYAIKLFGIVWSLKGQ